MPESQGKLLANLWKPSGAIYLGFCLIGLLAGLWSDAIYVNPNAFTTPVLPVYHTLTVAQILFFLLVFPLIILKRHQTNPTSIPAAVIEILGFFAVSIPFYFVAAKFSDTTLTDSVRSALTVAAFCPLGLAAGRLMTYNSPRPWVLLGLVGVTVAPVGLDYIFREFLHEVPAEWIWETAPVGFTWANTTQQISALLPRPLWIWCFWIFVSIPVCMIPEKSQTRVTETSP